MWDDVKAAAEWGLIWGVKLVVVGLVIAAGFTWFVNDIQTVRTRAFNGQRVHEFMLERVPDYLAYLRPRVSEVQNGQDNSQDDGQEDSQEDSQEDDTESPPG